MSLKNIATKNVITILSGSTVQEAAKIMREKHTGDLVVVKKGGLDGKSLIPLGIITDRDIVVSLVAYGIAPDTIYVDDMMGPNLITAKIDLSIFHVLNLMKENGIKRVPLVDGEGSLQGIVSSEDILSLLSSEFASVSKIKIKQKIIELEKRKSA